MSERCQLCGDDGWVETWVSHTDENGEWVGDLPVQSDCPYLNEPGHAPFNATGILGAAGVTTTEGQDDGNN